MSRLPKRVLAMLNEHGVNSGHRLGVGCSGGPDSAALAHVVLTLGKQGALGPVVLIYIDHGLRPDSAADARVVERLAGYGAGARVVVRKVRVDRAGGSLERAARDARYQAFDEVARAHDLDWILLAHTASDQAETVLMRLLRGTGVAGLAGIPARRDRYVRPLLGATRSEIEAHVRAHDVPAVHDPMNDDPAFLRNRVRHRWLPALRQENPRLDQALLRLAESAGAQREVLDFAALGLLDKARVEDPPGALSVPILAAAPDAVVRRALTLAIDTMGNAAGNAAGVGPLGASHLGALHELVRRPTAGSVSLDLPGLYAVREYDALRLLPTKPVAPGAGHGEAGFELPAAATLDADGEGDIDVEVQGSRPPYVVRRWQPGDRMRPARLKGRSRKLSDLFTDARVPRSARAHAIIVARQADGVIEWAQHIGPAWDSDISVVLTRTTPMASNKVTH